MATVEKITPKSSNPPEAACIHGAGLNEGSVPPRVMYGTRRAEITNLTPSGKQIFHSIPGRNPLDPNPVTVRVFTSPAGVEKEASYSGGPVLFEYGRIDNPPLLQSFSPTSVAPDSAFDLTIMGSAFVLPTRSPVAVYAVSVDNQNGDPALAFRTTEFTTPPSPDQITVRFGFDPSRGLNGLPLGQYRVFVEFTDSSALDSGEELLSVAW